MDKNILIFFSYRVTKKNPSKRPRIKFHLMKTMIMYKTKRPQNIWRQREQIKIGLHDGICDFIFTIQRMTFD